MLRDNSVVNGDEKQALLRCLQLGLCLSLCGVASVWVAFGFSMIYGSTLDTDYADTMVNGTSCASLFPVGQDGCPSNTPEVCLKTCTADTMASLYNFAIPALAAFIAFPFFAVLSGCFVQAIKEQNDQMRRPLLGAR